MTFHFRRSARLGPLRFNFAKSGLSSISIGGPGASLNLPMGRGGAPRSTLGLPGTGLSWSHDHGRGSASGLPNSRRLRPGQLESFKRALLEALRQQLFAPGRPSGRLWAEGLITRLLGERRLTDGAPAGWR
jgi:hypothetical protein